MDRRLTQLLGALIFCLVLALVLGHLKVSAAEREAIKHQTRADEMMRQREVAETLLAEMQAEYTAQRDSLAILHDSVEYATARARTERRRAATLADTLRSHVESVAGDSTAVVALVDSITVVHAEEVHALETQLGVALTENEALWRSVARADALLAQQVDVNELLQMEVTALRQTVAAWQEVARPGILVSLKRNLGLVGVSVGVGAIACLAVCK